METEINSAVAKSKRTAIAAAGVVGTLVLNASAQAANVPTWNVPIANASFEDGTLNVGPVGWSVQATNGGITRDASFFAAHTISPGVPDGSRAVQLAYNNEDGVFAAGISQVVTRARFEAGTVYTQQVKIGVAGYPPYVNRGYQFLTSGSSAVTYNTDTNGFSDGVVQGAIEPTPHSTGNWYTVRNSTSVASGNANVGQNIAVVLQARPDTTGTGYWTPADDVRLSFQYNADNVVFKDDFSSVTAAASNRVGLNDDWKWRSRGTTDTGPDGRFIFNAGGVATLADFGSPPAGTVAAIRPRFNLELNADTLSTEFSLRLQAQSDFFQLGSRGGSLSNLDTDIGSRSLSLNIQQVSANGYGVVLFDNNGIDTAGGANRSRVLLDGLTIGQNEIWRLDQSINDAISGAGSYRLYRNGTLISEGLYNPITYGVTNLDFSEFAMAVSGSVLDNVVVRTPEAFAVPEPATLAVFGMAGLSLRRRRA